MVKAILIFVGVCLIYIIWQHQELKKFKVTHYTVASEKIKEPVKLLLVSDFHCHPYGKENEKLMAAVRNEKPDVILVPGDMIVSAYTEKYPVALHFFKQLVQVAPVYFSNGNHESRVELSESLYYDDYQKYKKQVEALGVHLLKNQQEDILCKGNWLRIYGVDIPLECYSKGKVVPLPNQYMEQTLGEAVKDNFSILLAHNPMFSEDYAKWGADLVVSGHNHGGLIRIPGVGSLFSPQFQLFPKYDAGEFEVEKSKIIVSRGLGTHTFHIRIFDRAELAVIQLVPDRGIRVE